MKPRRRYAKAGISHSSKDAPIYTHRIYTVFYSFLGCNVLVIQDEDRTHYPFLKQWVGMEIDIECQWSINNGTLGLDMALHNNKKHMMEYCVKLKTKDAELILKTPYNLMGILNEQKRMIYAFKPLKVEELSEFLILKKTFDAKIKKEHLSPKGWSIE